MSRKSVSPATEGMERGGRGEEERRRGEERKGEARSVNRW